ncbi:MAG TPA: type II secretion system protein GspL [Burkholderiales bacterium]|nr:type II secretion system protein GspL [Burkholderiales bacterium]
MTTLRVFLCPLAELGAQSVLAYELLDRRRRIMRRGQAVPALLPKTGRCELVLAAPDVLLVDAALPKMRGARLRAALPMLVEEFLLGDMEDALVVAGAPDRASGRATVAMLDRALLQRALGLFAQLRIRVVSATPEPLTLAAAPGCWRVRLRESYGYARTGERLGIALSPALDAGPPRELALALAQQPVPSAIEIEGECDAAAWEEALRVPVRRVRDEQTVAPAVALELLQYEAAPDAADWSRWRGPVVLAAALLLLWIAGLNVQAWLLQREERALRAEMANLVRQAFPEVPVVLDPVVQMRQGVGELRAAAGIDSPTDFLPLATRFAQALADDRAVRSIEYRDAVLHVRFADAHLLESAPARLALSSRLAQDGLEVQFSNEGAVVAPRRVRS